MPSLARGMAPTKELDLKQYNLPGIDDDDAWAAGRTNASLGPSDLSDRAARAGQHRASPQPTNGVEPWRRGGLQDEGDNIPGPEPEPGRDGRGEIDEPKEPPDTEHVPKVPPRDGADEGDDGDGDGDHDRQPPSPDEHRPGRDVFDRGPATH